VKLSARWRVVEPDYSELELFFSRNSAAAHSLTLYAAAAAANVHKAFVRDYYNRVP